ncbi:MAG: PAS domain S-box protein [Gallionella sp.]|nr:PAS domain S-box protein [Gallionella sp.]
MRITTRLRIISIATAAALAVLAPVLVLSFAEFRSAKNDYALADAIKANFFERASFRDQYFLYREDRARMQWDKSRQTADRLLQQAVAQFQWEQNWQTLERLRRNTEDSATIFRRIVNNSEAMKAASSNRHVYEELDKRLSSQLLLKATEVRDAASALQEASARRAERAYEYLAAAIGLFAIMLALATILVSMHIGRLIRKRLAPLHDGARIVAGGNLDYRIKCDGSDEFAELALSINAMTDRLQAFTSQQEVEISMRKRAEEASARAEKRTRILFDSIADAIFISDMEGHFLRVNHSACERLGYSQEELLQMSPSDIDTPEYAAKVPERIKALQEQGKLVFESAHARRDGVAIPIELSVRVIDYDGKPCILGVARDIAERKRAEAALRESEQYYRNFFENHLATMFVINPVDGSIVDANPAAAAYYGWTREELKRKKISDINTLTPDQIHAEMELASAEKRNHFIFKHRLAHGEFRDVEVYSGPIQIRGRLLLYSIVLDITERKEFEAELKRSNAELEQFSYAVSHDMRQPLRMISSYLQLIERSLAGQLDNEKRGYFGFAIEGAKRIDQMLVALLEYSRAGRMGEPPTMLDSRAMLDEALQFLQPAIAEAQAEVNITGDWPRIFASHDEILRLLQNLISNAAKYRIAGRIPEIAVTSGIVKNEWHLCVADNGVGIIPDQIKRLFQVFQRLQSREAYEGTGIGLALCRKIAEHHKGRIWAESAGEDQGSRFYVVLPVPQ